MRLVVFLIALLLAACGTADLASQVAAQEDQALAVQYIDDVKNKRFDNIVRLFPPEERAAAVDSLQKMQMLMPEAQPKLVDARAVTFEGLNQPKQTNSLLTYTMENGDKRALVKVSIIRQGDVAGVSNIHVNPMSAPLETLNRFSLEGKSPAQYAFLAVMAASLATIVWAFVMLARSKGVRRRWLWAIAIAFGVMPLVMNWSTGEVLVQLGQIQLFGVGAVRPAVDSPWLMKVGVPLGALIFLWRRKRLLEGKRSSPADHMAAG
jgi:hypothetical protein